MPQTAQQISSALRGVAADKRQRAGQASASADSLTSGGTGARTAGAARRRVGQAKSYMQEAKDIDLSADYLDEANPSAALQKRNQAFAEAISGTTVRNSAEKMRMFGQTAVPGMPGVRKGGLTDLMTRGKR